MLIWNRYQNELYQNRLGFDWASQFDVGDNCFCSFIIDFTTKKFTDSVKFPLIPKSIFSSRFRSLVKNIGKWWNIVLIFDLIKWARILTLIKTMRLVYKFLSLESRFYNGANYCVIKYSKFIMQNSTCHCISYPFAYMSLGK